MFNNSHFAIATHILSALTIKNGERIPSSRLAASVGTNAAFLRQLMGRLKDAGLVDIKLGKGGGATLACAAEDVTLLDIYRAVKTCDPVKTHCSTPDTSCIVGRNVLPVLCRISEEVEVVIEDRLAQTSLRQVAQEIRDMG